MKYYTISLYSSKRKYITFSNNPENSNPYYNLISSFNIYNNIVVSDNKLKFRYDETLQLGYYDLTRSVGIKVYTYENGNLKSVLYYDVIDANIINGMIELSTKRYIWSDVNVYEQLCTNLNSYIKFERANYYPVGINQDYLIGRQDEIRDIDIDTLNISPLDNSLYSENFYFVVQFTMRNAKSSFTEQSYSNYIKTFIFNPQVESGLETITNSLNFIQKINAYYGLNSNPNTELQNVEINNIYVVTYPMIQNFIDETKVYQFKTVDNKSITAFGIQLNNDETLFPVSIMGKITSIDRTASKDKLNKKYYIGTYGKLIELTPEYTKNSSYLYYIRDRITLGNDIFKVELLVNNDVYDFTDEFRASTTTNSQASLSTDKMSRTLGIIGSAINGIKSIMTANIGGVVGSIQSLLNANTHKLGGGTQANGNYVTTYAILKNYSTDTSPFKIITYNSIQRDEYKNVDKFGLIYEDFGELLASSDTDIRKQFKIIQDNTIDDVLYVKGDLFIENQLVNQSILQEITSQFKNGIYYIVK